MRPPGRRLRRVLRRALAAAGWLGLAVAPAHAGVAITTLCYDTFLNSAFPNNNNGGSTTFFTGSDEYVISFMRSLVRCALPPALNDRVEITEVTFVLRTASLGFDGTMVPTAAVETLQRVTEDWSEGDGVGNTSGLYTVGQPCVTGEATWNQRHCMVAGWTTQVALTATATAPSPASIDADVVFDSESAGNDGLVADVAGWVATPASNYGWRIKSSTEGILAAAQRFYSSEAGAGQPRLAVTYDCKSGFEDTGTDFGCTTCTSAANDACVTSQPGNTCNDSGPPSTVHTCTCDNPAYVIGGGPGANLCLDRNECIPNHCRDGGDLGAACTDHAAPATGYSCTCDEGYTFDGTTCSPPPPDLIFEDGFEDGTGCGWDYSPSC